MLIETLNVWGDYSARLAWSMFWQSSLLIALVFAFDLAFRRKARAAVRYAVWMVVLLKLLLPPSLALPTGPAWWLSASETTASSTTPINTTFASAAVEGITPRENMSVSALAPPVAITAPARLTAAGSALLCSLLVSAGLLGIMFCNWLQLMRLIRRSANATDSLNTVLAQAREIANVRHPVKLRLTADRMSPAVYGFWRPVVLLPDTVTSHLRPDELRAVILHELIHLKRRDSWINGVQALLQIVYWWHPLVWLANAQIRRVREEAVDDAVMVSLGTATELYAPTLLAVARLSVPRAVGNPVLVEVIESRSALGRRVKRLVNWRPSRRNGLSLLSLIAVALFAAAAIPMSGAPADATPSTVVETSTASELKPPAVMLAGAAPSSPVMTESPRPIVPGRVAIHLNVFEVRKEEVAGWIADLLPTNHPTPRHLTGQEAAAELGMTPDAIASVQLIKFDGPIVSRVLTPDAGSELTRRLVSSKIARTRPILIGPPAAQDDRTLPTVQAGPRINVVPTIESDGSVRLSVLVQAREFRGYDDPGPGAFVLPETAGSSPSASGQLRSTVTTTTGPLPAGQSSPLLPVGHFVITELAWEGTIMSGGMLLLTGPATIDSRLTETAARPAGQQSRAERPTSMAKNLIVLITPTLRPVPGAPAQGN